MSKSRIIRENLQEVRAGQRISARTFNALVRAAKLNGVPSSELSFLTDNGQITRHPPSAKELWVYVKSDNDISTFSLCEVYDGEYLNDGPRLKVKTATSTAKWLAGTEAYELKANSTGWVKLVNPHQLVAVKSTGTPKPTFGSVCGVSSGRVTIATDYGRLVALTNTNSEDICSVIPWEGRRALFGKTPVAGGPFQLDTNVTVALYGGTSWDSLTALGRSVTARNVFGIIQSDKFVDLTEYPWGYAITAARCQ
jgi:hypothetical protein